MVFGDIGTNPLYVIRVVFGPSGQSTAVNRTNVEGILSLIIWSVTLVVSIKYIAFVMRANNKGEGGIMALASLVRSSGLAKRYTWYFIALSLVGVCLFYGDSAITPAISILSAVEGLRVVEPGLGAVVIPMTFIILAALFWIQQYGTAFIGKLFGPVMLLWFLTIATGGAWQIWQHPAILYSLSPDAALAFIVQKPVLAFVAMGSVVLAVTGAEALYADMGHFGRAPIARAWFWVVFPALALSYMGQGALLLARPSAITNPFMLLFPESVRFSIVILATMATLIASQSVISGAFSLTRQAVQLGLLPKMLVRYTSEHEFGQIYMPFVNLMLFVLVSLMVLGFGSSVKLASAYGMAVSGALLIDTILFVVVMRVLWHKAAWSIAAMITVFCTLDLIFVSSNLSKLRHGAWVPLALASGIFLVMNTWMKGQRLVAEERKTSEDSLQSFIDGIHSRKPPLRRVPGHVVYLSQHVNNAPSALRATVEDLNELSGKVVLVTVNITDEAHVPEEDRAVFDNLRYKDDGISHVTLSFGFHDSPNVPRALETLRHTSPELDFNPYDSAYFVSLSKVVRTRRRNMAGWRKTLYSLMTRNSLSVTDYYKLPVERTVEMSSLIKL